MTFGLPHKWQIARDERGAAILELAIVIPILLSIGLGVFEFGNIIYRYQLMTAGVRDGARFAAGLPYDSANTTQTDATKTTTQYIAARGVVSGGSNRVEGWQPGDVTVTYQARTDDGTICGTVATNAFCRGRDPAGFIYEVTVSTDKAYQSLGFLGYLGLGSITLHAEHTERHFGVH